GPLLDPADVADVITGIGERGVLGEADAVLSGYQGDPAVGAVILDAVAKVRAANPSAVYCCDPVMGDVGRGMFVKAGIPEYLRDEVVPRADIVTPNHFELDFLAGRTTTTLEEVLAAVDAVRETGPRDVLVTSVLHADSEPETLDVLAVSDAGAWVVTTPAPDRPQRVRRRHRGALSRPPLVHRLQRHGPGAHHVVGLRNFRGDAGGRHPGDRVDCRPGRHRGSAGEVRRSPGAVIRPVLS
ncbi:MAG: pyridoxal kinase, partial [Nocardioides sp.]